MIVVFGITMKTLTYQKAVLIALQCVDKSEIHHTLLKQVRKN